MRVKCKWSRNNELPKAYVDDRVPINSSTDWHLTTGKEYVVYGLECYEGKTWYYVVDDHNLWFPIMKPAPLFDIVDPKPSAYWQVNFKTWRDSTEILLLAFEEWCVEETYYERLSDKNPPEVAIFVQRRKEMDSE